METLRYVLLANSLLVVISIAYYVLLRRETFFGANRLALWVGLAASLGLPLLELPDWRPQPVKTAMQRTARVIVPKVLSNSSALQPNVTITFPNGQLYPAMQQPALVWSWQTWLLRVYVAGVLLLLIRFGIRLVLLGRLIRKSVHEPYDDFTLVRNGQITSPFSFFGWVVLNPDYHDSDELEQIMRHERVHVRARHSIDMMGAEVICIGLWFNPAAYLFRYMLHQTLEFSADRAVLAEGVDAKAYQYNLVKVSLAGGRSALTNHFSRSQLKSRIIMLNKPESAKTTWLKYPVLGIATLTVVAAFARPSARTLKKFIQAPVAQTIAAVTKAEPMALPKEVVKPDATKPVVSSALKPKQPIQPTAIQSDTVSHSPNPDTVRTSPSRYMVYQGNYLYWIVTPKTTFDDFALMKQEFARHGYQMQLNEIQYDPLYAYIDRVVVTVARPTGGMTRVNELDDDLKPVPTNAGYIGIKDSQAGSASSSRLEGRYSKTFPLYQTEAEEEFPDILRKVAADDEAAIAQFINGKKMEYLVIAGERKYGHLGVGFRKFDKKEIKKQSRPNSSLSVKPDGSLSVNEDSHTIKTFINNESVSQEDIRRIKIDQLYTVAVVLGYDDSTQKRTMTDYFLFYVNQDH